MKTISILITTALFYLIFNTNPDTQISPQEDLRTSAFKVLVAKCNTCHLTKKRQDIFTLRNMDSLAFAINKQVFIKKRMPKGKKVKLTEAESKSLHLWLSLTLKESSK